MVTVRAPAFRGRKHERAVLDGMIDGLRTGESSVLVMRGEAGMGKTALLQYCARGASRCRVAQISGVEFELEMPFAALQQLCGPMLEKVDVLPAPQRQALAVAFGLTTGSPPDRFVVGLAVLGLLAEVASELPLLCLVDDAQWLDQSTREVLAFVGRRLHAEAVMLVFAVRDSSEDDVLDSLPALTIEGLEPEDAAALITAAVPGHLDERVRDRLVAETQGSPLRLLELPREMSSAELAGGFRTPRALTSHGQLEEHYAQRIRALPEATQRLLLLAAADPTGDASLLWLAAQNLGIPRSSAVAHESEELLEIGSRVRFCHPVVRSAAYASGSLDARRSAHLALADAIDPERDLQRRVWHLAAAATGPDDGVASQLERTAAIAQSRAGLAAAAAFLERAVELTSEPERRAGLALAAAHAHMHAGSFDAALRLLAEAQALASDEVQRARVERLRGDVQYSSEPRPEAPAALVEIAKRLELLDVDLARETYLDAWMAALAAGQYALPGGLLREVSEAARSAPPARMPSPHDLLLDGLATSVTDGRAAGAHMLREAVDAFLDNAVADSEILQWGHLATGSAAVLWDWRRCDAISAKHVEIARASGALAPLSNALNARALVTTWFGDFQGAASVVAECDAVNDAIGIGVWGRRSGLLLRAYRGRPDDLELMFAMVAESADRGVGLSVQRVLWTAAVLCNGLCRYDEAVAAATRAAYESDVLNGPGWALVELVESAVRSKQPHVAEEAVERLSEFTLEEADWAVGLEARCRALVTPGPDAELWYLEAIERLKRTPVRTETARAQLLYGEWLRREGRRIDARVQLAAAHEMFAGVGAEAFEERTRRELLATGERVRKRSVHSEASESLTPQEESIARLARAGRSNSAIAAELFVSPRTVEWHLRKVFVKLGITSRKELEAAMPTDNPLRGGRPGVIPHLPSPSN